MIKYIIFFAVVILLLLIPIMVFAILQDDYDEHIESSSKLKGQTDAV